jgi:hypothetical protein
VRGGWVNKNLAKETMSTIESETQGRNTTEGDDEQREDVRHTLSDLCSKGAKVSPYRYWNLTERRAGHRYGKKCATTAEGENKQLAVLRLNKSLPDPASRWAVLANKHIAKYVMSRDNQVFRINFLIYSKAHVTDGHGTMAPRLHKN